MKDLISVIINVYNGEEYIEKCIKSVINQTYKNLEILIINDGSTDNTLKICKSFKDKRIKIITTKNLGLSLSRNIGIDNSNGKYLYFIDADDFIESDTIEYLYNLIKENKADISTCNPFVIFDYNYKLKQKKEKIDILDSITMLKKVLLLENMSGTIWNKLIKKELFNDIRFEDRIINDVVVVYKLVINSKRIVYSNQYKYYYLKHKNCISLFGYEKYERSVDFYNAINERYNNIKNRYPTLIENDIAVLKGILKLYLLDNIKIHEYLAKEKVINRYKELFTMKMLFSSIKLKEKIKLLLFRISPKLYIKIGKLHRKKYKNKL